MDTATLQINKYPHPALKAISDKVVKVDDSVEATANQLLRLMKTAGLTALAAPQAGVSQRLVVALDAAGAERVLINPTLTPEGTETKASEETTPNIPGVRIEVTRSVKARLSATGLDGQAVQLSADGAIARAWQQACDHLDGKLITDRMSPLEKRMYAKKIQAMEDAAAGAATEKDKLAAPAPGFKPQGPVKHQKHAPVSTHLSVARQSRNP